MKSKDVQKRFRETMKSKYGVEYTGQSKFLMSKARATNLKKYGVEHNWEKGFLRTRLENYWFQKYGTHSPISSDVVRARVKHTMQLKYGADHNWSASCALRANYIQTMKERYGTPYPLQNHDIKLKHLRSRGLDWDKRFLIVEEVRSNLSSKNVKKFWDLNYSQSWLNVKALELKIKKPKQYSTQEKLAALLNELGVEYERNLRKKHGVKKDSSYYDMDFMIKVLGKPYQYIGIEINGLEFHSANSKLSDPTPPEYHFEKFRSFYDHDILVISFTDYEQVRFREDYEGIIRYHVLGELYSPSSEFLEFNNVDDITRCLNYGLFNFLKLRDNFDRVILRKRLINGYEYTDCGIIGECR